MAQTNLLGAMRELLHLVKVCMNAHPVETMNITTHHLIFVKQRLTTSLQSIQSLKFRLATITPIPAPQLSAIMTTSTVFHPMVLTLQTM